MNNIRRKKEDIGIPAIVYPGDKIIRRATADAYKEIMALKKGRGVDERGAFVIAKSKSLMGLEGAENSKRLTVTDRRYLMKLLLLASFNSYDKAKTPLIRKGRNLSKEIAADLWGVAEETAKKRLNRLVRAGLLLVERDLYDRRRKLYYLNNVYFVKGIHTNKNEKFVKIFQKKLKEIFRNVENQKQRNLHDKCFEKQVNYEDAMGLLQAVIPYFHFETYYLVSNQDEKITLAEETVLQALDRNKNALKHLSLAQLRKISGLGDNETVKKYFAFLEDVGAVLKTEDKLHYRIHPGLLFRLDGNGKDDYTKRVINEFLRK